MVPPHDLGSVSHAVTEASPAFPQLAGEPGLKAETRASGEIGRVRVNYQFLILAYRGEGCLTSPDGLLPIRQMHRAAAARRMGRTSLAGGPALARRRHRLLDAAVRSERPAPECS